MSEKTQNTNAADNKGQQQEQQGPTLEEQIREYNGSRIKLFWVLLRARFGLLVKINLMMVLFALPMIAVVIVFNMMHNALLATQPFSSTLLSGYPVILDAATGASTNLFMYRLWGLIGLSAGMPIFMIGICGAMYTLKFVAKGQMVKVISTFFIGIKKCIVPFLIIGPIVAGLVFVMSVGVVGFDHYMYGQNGAKIALLIITGIISLVVLFAAFSYTTMSVTYRMNPWQITKNAFRIAFTPRLLIRHFIIAAISSIPVLLMVLLLGTQFGFIIVMIFAMLIMLSFVFFMWLSYSNWIFKAIYTPTVSKRKTTGGEAAISVSFSSDEGETAGVATTQAAHTEAHTEISASDITVNDTSDVVEETNSATIQTQNKTTPTEEFEDLGELEASKDANAAKPKKAAYKFKKK